MNHTEKLLNYLAKNDVYYKHLTHPECRTSGESRQARIDAGGDDVIGAKAIVMKMDRQDSNWEFNMFVLPGTHKLDSAILKAYFKPKIKSFRFATTEELSELTGGLVPGSIPPFGQPILEKINHIFVDLSLLNYDQIGFNAASLTQSLIIQTQEYLQVVQATDLFKFSMQ